MNDTWLWTTVGELRGSLEGPWFVKHDGGADRFDSLGDALVALSDRCEGSALSYSVRYHSPMADLLDAVRRSGGSELFPSLEEGWSFVDEHWIPNALLPGGDAESVADLVAEAGDMGVHVELFNYGGIYVMRWVVVDFDDEGTTVLGAITEEDALSEVEGKAEALGADNGLEVPYMLGLANLESSERFSLPEGSTLAATASSAWPYDTTIEVVVSIYLCGSGASEAWLVTGRDSTEVVGSYETWPELSDELWVPDSWEIAVDWAIDEPAD